MGDQSPSIVFQDSDTSDFRAGLFEFVDTSKLLLEHLGDAFAQLEVGRDAVGEAERLVDVKKVAADDLQVHSVHGYDPDLVVRLPGWTQHDLLDVFVAEKIKPIISLKVNKRSLEQKLAKVVKSIIIRSPDFAL